MNSRLEWLRDYQDRAHRLGLYPAPGDGQYGPDTEKAFNAVFAAAEKAQGVKPPPFAYPNLPARYQWLLDVGTLPKMLHEALKLLGTTEVAGSGNSAAIMAWIAALKAAGYETAGLTSDMVPWCGSFLGYVALLAGKTPPKTFAWARSWSKFGVPANEPMLGDVLVWARGSAGHVNIMLGEDDQGYLHGVGGNQKDAVNIMRKHPGPPGARQLIAVRRPVYRVQPQTVKRYKVSATGAISRNEA